MEDDILKEEDDLDDIKLPPEIEKSGDVPDEDLESVDELVKEEEEDVEPYDDVDPL